MNKIFKFTNHQFEPVDKIAGDCWVNVVNPDNNELKKLSNELNIPLDFLTDPLDIDERARIEKDSNATLIILRVPVLNEDNINIPFMTIPIGIILINQVIITVCSSDVGMLLVLPVRTKQNLSQFIVPFLLSIFSKTAQLYLEHLKKINRKSTTIELELHKAMKNEQLLKLFGIERSLVFFSTSLRSNEFMMERLQKIKAIRMDNMEEDMLYDIIIDNKQAIEMANIYSSILSGMMDAFASVISNNLNAVMKLLTSITIVLMIPTLMASVYGMNVKLPFQDSPHAFLITIGMASTLLIIGVLVFIKRKWF